MRFLHGAVVYKMLFIMSFNYTICRYGLFGAKLEKPAHPTLNYIGVALTVFSIITFFFVETVDIATMNIKSISTVVSNPSINNEKVENVTEKSKIDLWLESFGETSKKFIGIGMDVFSGILYGPIRNFFPFLFKKLSV